MLSTSRKGISKRVLNPTKSDRKRGIYRPYLTLNNRANKEGMIVETLTIQASLPKLIFGNNFDELTENDFPRVMDALKHSLKMMDVGVFEHNLEQAEVIGIHYGKNFTLQDGTTPKMIIDKVAQGDYFKSLDTEKATYRNNGLGWKLHTNRFELTFYDKKADLLRAKISDGRSEETDNYVQLGLFDKPRQYKPFEVLRMEARLDKKATIKHVFTQAKITTPHTFRAMFSEQVTRDVLLYNLDMVEKARPPYFDYHATSQSDLLSEITINNPKLGLTNLLATTYLKGCADQNDTLGGIRQIVGSKRPTQWRRLMNQAKAINITRQSHPFASIRSQIENYQPLHLVDFHDLMLNNDKYEH